MPSPTLRYAITDRHLVPPHQPHLSDPPSSRPERSPAERSLYLPSTTTPLEFLLHQALYLCDQSVDYLQIREKDLNPRDLLALAHVLRKAIPLGSKPHLLLNLGGSSDRVVALKIAASARLDGIHLSSTIPVGFSLEMFARAARNHFAAARCPPPVLSLSVHGPEEIAAALHAQPDFLLFGPVFGKVVHGTPTHPPLGLPALAEAVLLASPTPVLALGGLTPENTPAALATGAAGIASIRLFLPPRQISILPPNPA